MFIVYNFFQTLFFIFRHVFRTKTKHSQPLIFWNKKTEEQTRNSEPDQIWSNLIKSDQIWSNLIKTQIWSDLIKFDQIWSDLVKLVFSKNKAHKNNLFVLFQVFFGNWTWLWLQLLSFKHSLAVKGWLLQKNYVPFQAPVFVLRSTDCKAFGHSFWLESNAQCWKQWTQNEIQKGPTHLDRSSMTPIFQQNPWKKQKVSSLRFPTNVF